MLSLSKKFLLIACMLPLVARANEDAPKKPCNAKLLAQFFLTTEIQLLDTAIRYKTTDDLEKQDQSCIHQFLQELMHYAADKQITTLEEGNALVTKKLEQLASQDPQNK